MNRLRLHYFLTDYYTGLIIVFLPLLFRNILMLDEFQIGKLYLFGSIIAMLSSLINGYIAQKVKKEKYVLSILISSTIILLILGSLTSGAFSLIIVMFGLFLIRNVSYIIGDEIAITYCNMTYNADFGKVRSFGSLGWGLNFLLNGIILIFYSKLLFFIILLVTAILLINSLFLPNLQHDKEIIKIKDIKEILDYRNFLFFALIIILMWGVLNNMNMYIEYAISDINGSLLLFYIFNAVVLLLDFIIMNNSTKLIKRLKAKKYFLLVVLFMIIKLILITALFNNFIAIFTILFDPLFFGLFVPFIGVFIKAEMPKHLSTVSLSIIPAFQNISVGVLSMVFGYIYMDYSYTFVFLSMLVIFVIIISLATKVNFQKLDNVIKERN